MAVPQQKQSNLQLFKNLRNGMTVPSLNSASLSQKSHCLWTLFFIRVEQSWDVLGACWPLVLEEKVYNLRDIDCLDVIMDDTKQYGIVGKFIYEAVWENIKTTHLYAPSYPIITNPNMAPTGLQKTAWQPRRNVI